MTTPPTQPAKTAFCNLEPLTTQQIDVKNDFIDSCKNFLEMIRVDSADLLAAYAHDLNTFNFASSWKSPNSMLKTLNDNLNSLHLHLTFVLDSLTYSEINLPPIALEQNKQWIAGLKTSPETTEQPAAVTEPALEQSA